MIAAILGKDIESENIDNESFDRDKLGIFELDKYMLMIIILIS